MVVQNDCRRLLSISVALFAPLIICASCCGADRNSVDKDFAYYNGIADKIEREYFGMLEAGVATKSYERREMLSEFADLAEESHAVGARLEILKSELLNRILEDPHPLVFGDYAHLNRQTESAFDTCAAFLLLVEADKEAAELAYLAAEDALVKHSQWSLCREYLDVTDRLTLVRRRWLGSRERSVADEERALADYVALKKLRSLHSLAILVGIASSEVEQVELSISQVLQKLK